MLSPQSDLRFCFARIECVAKDSGNLHGNSVDNLIGWLLVGFVALRPKSTAMVIAGRSVHLTTLFPGQT